jgi:hypothetical protein
MANPTTYFGWVMPNSADLVTDLPADFNVFGQGVDTSMQDLLGGTTGQVLSKTSGTNMDFTWVTPTDQTPLTTKGDLFSFTTVDARLAVGANETRLVSDSVQATGLKYVADTTNYAIAAKADLLVGTAADTLASLTVGTNGQVLTADSTVSPTGLKWATPAAAASGLTFISRTSLSASASPLSLNSIFTSTYDNYRISMTITQSSTSTGVSLNLRASGSDDSTSNYHFGRYGRDWAGASFSSQSSTGVTTFQNISYNENNKQGAFVFDVTNPQVAEHTSIIGAGTLFAEAYNFMGQLKTTTQYDGCTFSWSGNLTAVITVYGLAKS